MLKYFKFAVLKIFVMFQLISKKGIKYFDKVEELGEFLRKHPRLSYRVCYLGDKFGSLGFFYNM